MSAQPFDWTRQDYGAVYAQRAERLARLRESPSSLPALFAFYAQRPADFISDWGSTFDPRNPERGLPSTVPFLLFDRQRELIAWLLERWRAQEGAIIEKSRDMGCSWLLMCFACTMCLFNRGLTFGVGSRKEELVDRSGDPSSLFYKARAFLQALPPEFLQGWTMKYSAERRIVFPHSGSAIFGESGDGIGRGARASMFIIDEAAHLEHPALIDASLSATTNCRVDVSTPAGRANNFAERRFSGRIPVFTMHWRSDPRKSQAWYEKQKATLAPEVLAAEVDLDYSASTTGLLIKQEWARSAIGAAEKLGIKVSGAWRAALDPADEGRDDCALAIRHGIELKHLESWSGKDSNIYQSTARALNVCDAFRIRELTYDSDGLGSACRGDIAAINEARTAAGKHPIADEAFRGSGSVPDPDGELVPSRQNRDFFSNRKALSWWHIARRFEAMHRAITEKIPVRDADLLVSIDPSLPQLEQLIAELTQPTYSINTVGKVVIDKMPDRARSPNLADSVMMVYGPREGDHSAGYFSALLEAPATAADEPESPGIVIPGRPGCIVASLCAGLPPFEDTVAVCYLAWCDLVLPDSPLIVVDWQLEELGGDGFTTLIPRVLARMRELIKETNPLQPGARLMLIDSGGVGVQLYCDACDRGIEGLILLDENIAGLNPTARAVSASGHVLRGKVKASIAAAEKTATLKAATKNWLMPIMNFSARSPESAGPLLAPLSNIVLDTFINDKRTLAPKKRAIS
jgi:phage terminase large subunit